MCMMCCTTTCSALRPCPTDSIVIVSAARTPIGGLLGDFTSLAAWELGGVAIQAAVQRAGVPGDAVDEVLMGNCLMAGQGQAPARQACAGPACRSRPAP
jgi:acetyl-CoA C-acetyltransferase